jgi:hypothetical protein
MVDAIVFCVYESSDVLLVIGNVRAAVDKKVWLVIGNVRAAVDKKVWLVIGNVRAAVDNWKC